MFCKFLKSEYLDKGKKPKDHSDLKQRFCNQNQDSLKYQDTKNDTKTLRDDDVLGIAKEIARSNNITIRGTGKLNN